MHDTIVTPALRVSRLQETNFKRISSLTIAPGSRVLVILQGPNEAGKTSTLDGLVSALAGKKASPAVPIRKGEEVASIEVELSDALKPRYQIQRWWKGERTGLNVYALDDNGNRGKVQAQQTLLDSLVSDLSFDPLAFAKTEDRRSQIRQLMAAIGKPDYLDQIDARRAAIAEDRRVLSARVRAADAELAGPLADPSPGQTLQELTAEAVTARLDGAEQQNSRRRRVSADIASAEAEAVRAGMAAEQLQQQIRALEARRAQCQTDEDAALQRRARLCQELQALPAEVSTADISAELARIQAHNEQARRQAAHHARRAERDAAEAQARALTVQLAALDDEVEATLTASEIGRSVPGLSFAAGDLLHEGIPFSQASGMRRLELSALIGMAANPRLRIMCIDEGDQLDDAAMARLRDLAKARDYQVWMTAIRAGDEHDADTCLIRINNGTAEGGSCLPALSASCTMSPEALPGLSLDL